VAAASNRIENAHENILLAHPISQRFERRRSAVSAKIEQTDLPVGWQEGNLKQNWIDRRGFATVTRAFYLAQGTLLVRVGTFNNAIRRTRGLPPILP
jgi:hypothetical protein